MGVTGIDLRGAPARRYLVRAVVASMVGSTIEWYDFLLYTTAAPLVFARLFFPSKDPLTGVLLAFSTQFVGFAARPLGGLIFGHFGDRVGRKATMIATLMTMGLATATIGILPTYASVGALAGVLLTACRVLQGIGVGGEWAGGVVLSMEWGRRYQRGLVTGWAQIGGPLGGGVLAPASLLIVSQLFPHDFLTWAWRIPFLVSLLLIVVGLYMRLGVLETPLFSRLLEERRIERVPVVMLFERHWKEVILSALVALATQAPVYLFTSFALAYGTARLKLSRDLILGALVFGNLIAAGLCPVAGFVSDWLGRKRVYRFAIVSLALLAFPYFWLMDTRDPTAVVFAVVLSQIPFNILFATLGALIAETFTGRVRYSGASLGYNLTAIIAGGPAPLIATYLLATFNSSTPIALYIIAISIVSLVALALLPNRSLIDHNVEYDEVRRPLRLPPPRDGLAREP
jgi:MFS family permease